MISSILKMHREGLLNCAIARVLTEMKVPTKQQGKAWHHEMVRLHDAMLSLNSAEK